MKHVAILCGGTSYEHEVSIITGIQVAEALDKATYTFSLVYFDKNNNAFMVKNFRTRKDFRVQKHVPVDIVKRGEQVVIATQGTFGSVTPVDVFYLAFHGGTGESGGVQGMLELYGAAFTGPSSESAGVVMNKALTKEVLRAHNVPTLPCRSVHASDYIQNKDTVLKSITDSLSLPVIIKPVHLGSSIGIEIAHTEVELEKYLNVATRLDTEVVVEPALQDFTEYNVSVRSTDTGMECSPIEEPKREGEVLSFDDKYANGSKKTSNKQGGGMELLDRTVPADISSDLRDEILSLAKNVYRVTRLDGLVRIDFMYSGGELYCTEINPIPGSMSFYLWEAAGEQFTNQITQSLENAADRFTERIKIEPYDTDIVDKFVA